MICDDTEYSFGRTAVDCVWITEPPPALSGPLSSEYAGAREFAPFPGRATVRPIALLLCLVFALQSRADAAAPTNVDRPALSPASPESPVGQSRPASGSVEATLGRVAQGSKPVGVTFGSV